MNTQLLARAIQAKRAANGIHLAVLELTGDTKKEIEAAKQAVRSEYPLFDCRFFILCGVTDTNG